MVWPTRVRHPERKHAFEEALDDARLDPDGGGPLFDEPSLVAPAVGSLGDITVASGYVAPASLARAYGSVTGPAEEVVRQRPAEAAEKLKAALVEREHSAKELKALRRRFAALHHPDSVAEDLRTEAVAAMADVNAVIDRALKRAPPV
ncbi:hypothetical protein [uncultured Hyphomicrobium sp.]|uniref:hypothetical protein n=1 Tax=uncultured Hyphomicrobium sp. TaxID=194373 RepID=UPI0025FF7A0A|nr:hypothetical protein [uncultured Hyphomicrobium sp.]